MCKRNLFCFCVFCLLLSSLFLLFLCASATVSAEKQPHEDIHPKAENESHEKMDINKELSAICAVFSGLHEWKSFVYGNVSKLDEISSDVVNLLEMTDSLSCDSQSRKNIQSAIKALKEKTSKTNEEMVQLCQRVKENSVTQESELQEGKIEVKGLKEVVFQNAGEWDGFAKKDVTEELQAVNNKCEVKQKINDQINVITQRLASNPDHKDTWTAQKNKYDLFLTHTNQAEKAAQTVQQTAEELFKKLPELDKIIKAEEIKAEQEPPNDKTVEEKNGDMSEGNKDINENPQQPADAERTEKNDRNVTDASTVQTQTGTDGINQQAPVENTDKTNESSDTLNNQTPPNNNTKNKQLSSPPPTTEDSAVRVGVVGVLCFMLAMLCVSAPLLHL